MTETFPYSIIESLFEYNGIHYKVVLAPELYPAEGGLDFTGCYAGILISETRGTKTFELSPDPHTRWETVPKSMDPGLVDEFDRIIREFRSQDLQNTV